MNKLPEYDVVIPTFNGAEFLAKSIKSALEQTIRSKNIFVVDDGSTDRTNKVLSELKGKIKVLKHKKNRGLPAARNTGIKAGSAPLVAFLDSDDFWLPNKMELQLQEFIREKIPGLCYTSLIDCDKDLNAIYSPRKFKRRVCERVFNELYTKPFPMPPSTVVVTREAIENCGYFDEQVLKIQDYECWLRISMSYPVSCIPRALCLRRNHDKSISSNYAKEEKLYWEFMVIDKCADAAKKNNYSLPLSVDDRRILAIKLRLRNAIRWNDKIGAKVYKNKLDEFGYYSALDNFTNSLISIRTAILVKLSLIKNRFKNILLTLKPKKIIKILEKHN